MKKFTLLAFLLATLSMQAKFFDGTLTYKDGTTKSGLIEKPNKNAGKVRFMTAETDKPQLIDSDLVEELSLLTEDGEETYLYLYPALQKRDGIEKEKSKKWFRVMSLGNVNFLYYDMNVSINDDAPGTYYHIHIPGEDHALYFTTKIKDMPNRTLGEKKRYKMMVKRLFADICPELVKKFDSGEYKADDMKELISLYKNTCN